MRSTLFTGAVAALFALSAAAQDAPQFLRVFQADIEPNTQQAYEAVLKRFAEASKTLDTKRFYFVATEEIGNPTRYTFARTFGSFAAMDEAPRNPLVEALGAEEAAKVTAPVAGKVLAQRTLMYAVRMDLSPKGAGPTPDNPPALINWLQVKIKPYGNAAYEEYLKKVAEATEKTTPQFPYTVYAPGPGADNTYGFANPIATWASMDEGGDMSVPERLAAAFGDRQARQLLEQRSAVVDSQSTIMVRPRPDLSYQP